MVNERSRGLRALTVVLGLWWLLLARTALAAPHGPFNRPGDTWQVTETRYFKFYSTPETPNTLALLTTIADETFERLNAFYGVRLTTKIGVTLVGYTSFTNGFAEFQRDRITIYTTPANFHSRSRVPWLENVFTHELSHVLSLNRASYWTNRVPLVLGAGVARSSSGQALARVPIYASNLPHWLVEGVAQFDTSLLGRDAFDENRRAFERAAIEDGHLFSLGKLAFFGDEKWYNTGFSFLAHLEARFGSGTVHRLFRRAGERYGMTLEPVFSDVLGVSLAELEREFRKRVERDFEAHFERVQRGRYDGRALTFADEEVPYSARTPAQREDLKEAYSSRPIRYHDGRLFFRRGDRILQARFTGAPLALAAPKPLAKGHALAPYGQEQYLVLRQEGHEVSLIPDVYRPVFESTSLFVVDRRGNERRLLNESRLAEIDACRTRRELAGVYNDGDGSLRLVLYRLSESKDGAVHLDARSGKFPLAYRAFDEVRSPRYNPDCSRLYFSRRVGTDHDIYYLDFASWSVRPVATEDAFELYPEPTDDGVYFVSARDGSMSVYFAPRAGGAAHRITAAVTAHHYPVRVPAGLVFSRLYATGFQAHIVRDAERPGERVQLAAATTKRAPAPLKPRRKPEGYAPFAPHNWTPPSFVPLVDVEYDDPSLSGGGASAQVGAELYIEDQLRTHSLWFRAFVGSRSNVFVSYRNDMTWLSLEARAGFTQTRGVYTFDRSDGQSFNHVTDYRWGFLYGAASVPLNLFYRVGVEAETLRDLGSTVGAERRAFGLGSPRYGRDMAGLFVNYSGIDRSDPTFRERFVNKRGYREFNLRASYAVEELHPSLTRLDASLTSGRKPYARAELNHTEYLALPTLLDGFYDHTLQLDVKLGAISRDIRFLPFYGGGRLYTQTSAELNTSVGFAGYAPYSLVGETLMSVGATYRFPLARRLSLDWGPLFLEDIYAQVFTSWGNIWGFDADGERQIPFVDRAANGRFLLGDFGVDVRLLSFFQEVESNVGTTLRVAYRAVPFSACPGQRVEQDPSCLGVNGSRGLMYYLLLGAGF